ncbi:MAG: DUF4403 family protein [Saprospiraceae bacterium]
MQENSILIDFKFSKEKLDTFIQGIMDEHLDQTINTEGFEIHLKKSSGTNVRINARIKSVFADVPLAFVFVKKAGLFSIEGEGSILANMEIQCDIDQNFGLTTKTILHGYQWKDAPKIHLGDMSLPIETISNCIIEYMKQSMLEKLDKRLAETSDIKNIINQQIKQFAHNYPIYKKPDLFFNGSLLQIQSGLFREDECDIHLDLWMEFNCKISDQPLQFDVNSDTTFYWADKREIKSSQKIDVELSYNGIAKMIMQELNGREIGGKKFELESVNIRNTSGIEIKAAMIEPIKGILTITGQPYLDKASQKIHFDNADIDMDASNLIYKISSPIIEKIMMNQLNNILPFDPSPYLKQYVGNIPEIQLFSNKISLVPSFSKLYIDQLSFSGQNMVCCVVLDDAEVDVVM